MGAAEIFLTAGRLALLLAGLLLPGAVILRSLRLPWMLAGSFAASAAAVYASVVLFALLHVPISLGTLAAALGLVTLAAAGCSRLHKPRPAEAGATGPFAFLLGLGAWTPLLGLFWAIVAWRLLTQPLSGGDIDFRWSWLAEQMLRQGSLDFYPPRSAADFARYFWVESLPPGVAGLHAWAYACGASTRALWTSTGVGLQLLALHDLIWRLAAEWGGKVAARRAVLLAAATPLLTWAVLMGQETGLTAVAVCTLCLSLVRWQRTRATGWLVLAALGAVVGSGTREYGFVFPLLGCGLLALLSAPRRAWLFFAGIAVPAALVWPGRTWVLTGNPFYSLDLCGLFPVNPVFVAWSASLSAGTAAEFATLAGWREIALSLVLCAPAALLGWLALGREAVRGRPEARGCALAAGVVALLWLASVPYTGGGLFYSLRVLSPAFALGAVAGGFAWSAWAASAKGRRAADLGLAGLVLVTLPFTLTLPHPAYRLPLRAWPKAGRIFVDARRAADADLACALQQLPDHRRILSECVSLPRALAPAGIAVIPLWSPEVAWLFDRGLPPAEIARRWAHSGLRYLVMTRSPAQLGFLSRRVAWTPDLFDLQQVWQSDDYVIFVVAAHPPAGP